MAAFVFRFGYESPVELASNEQLGTNLGSSQWVVIDASDVEAALAWGREVAERFVQRSCGRPRMAGGFAHWVEPLSARPLAAGQWPVAVGQFPTTPSDGLPPPARPAILGAWAQAMTPTRPGYRMGSGRSGGWGSTSPSSWRSRAPA